MATFNYLLFSSKQGLLVGNGGPWECSGFSGSCAQSPENNAYGPITSISTPYRLNGQPLYRSMTLGATISLADDEFMGATSVPFTLSFLVQATAQGDTDTIGLRSVVGGVAQVLSSLHLNNPNPISAIYSGQLGSRPSQIAISIELGSPSISNATVAATISNLNFVIHDVVYGGTFVAGSSPSASSALSPFFPSSAFNSASSLTSSINNRTSPSRSILATTSILGHQTTIWSTQAPSSHSEFQSYPSTPSNSPIGASMNTSERASVILISLLGLVVILATIVFWWWRRRRRRMAEKTVYGDRQSETDVDSRVMNEGPRPYHRRTHVLSAPSVASVVDETIEPTELEGNDTQTSLWQTEETTSQTFGLSSPAPFCLTPRLHSRSMLS